MNSKWKVLIMVCSLGTGYYFLRGVVWGALINFLVHEIVSRQVKLCIISFSVQQKVFFCRIRTEDFIVQIIFFMALSGFYSTGVCFWKLPSPTPVKK